MLVQPRCLLKKLQLLIRAGSRQSADVALHRADRHWRAIAKKSVFTGRSFRRELMRQYPRHSWPEDPTTALPPAPRKR